LTFVDPGPTSCLPALERGLARLGASLGDVRRVLLTHIHLDHAGAAGTIVARVPSAHVFVHTHGLRHLVDPARLLASVTRLYGDQMEALWGAFDPVPASRLTALEGGERLDVAGRPFRVAYTPGHASHHVSFLDESEGLAYVGDTCGVRVGADYVLAATPPPDIDLPEWRRSLDIIDEWQPVTLFLTHFGSVTPARPHTSLYREVLADTAGRVRRLLEVDTSDEGARTARFVDEMRRHARQRLSEEEVATLERAAPFDQLWAGLARHLRKAHPGSGLGD
jgi:glyoxylase-like metal-dependent hydrolase (beta-lactamase superfamily II)